MLDDAGVALIPENPLFGQRIMQRRRREKGRDAGENVIKNLTELREGAPGCTSTMASAATWA